MRIRADSRIAPKNRTSECAECAELEYKKMFRGQLLCMVGRRNYGTPRMFEKIVSALKVTGIDVETSERHVLKDSLKAVDEFHVGGQLATAHLVKQLWLEPGMKVLDIGSGLGGTARFIGSGYPGVSVRGIDITREFVDVAEQLTQLVMNEDEHDISFSEGSALAVDAGDATFDRVIMLHVGMNIEDKEALFKEVYRLLKPDGLFALYDMMHTGEKGKSELSFPLPWASTSTDSFVGTQEDYVAASTAAGFKASRVQVTDRSQFAKDFFKPVHKRLSAGPDATLPPLSMMITFGDHAVAKMRNIIHVVKEDIATPKEMIFIKGST